MLFFKPLAGIILILALVLTQGCIVTRGTVGEPLQEKPYRPSRKAQRPWKKSFH